MHCRLGLEKHGTFISRILVKALSDNEARNVAADGPGCKEGMKTGTE